MAEFELMPNTVLVKSLTGCGVQFNQHAFANFTGASPASHSDLEAKVLALAPHFVRIFYSDNQEGLPSIRRSGLACEPEATPPQVDKWDSFVKTVRLSRRKRPSTSPGRAEG